LVNGIVLVGCGGISNANAATPQVFEEYKNPMKVVFSRYI